MPPRRDEDNLKALAAEWGSRLRACQYAGELVVEETRLPALARIVRRDLFSDRRSRLTTTCLFVLAVNCMYYHHDEQGFWVHFCRLMEVPNTPANQSWLGDMIESQLLEFQFLATPGYGPFKYVTPLREQCGITRTEIPRFADLLSKITGNYGWDGIRVLEQTRLEELIANQYPTGHLSQFLRSDPGESFIRDVARNVSQYQRKIITLAELRELPGYRTGFFADLFDSLGRVPEETGDSVSRPPSPRLLFIPEYRRIALYFDPQAVGRGRYKLNAESVTQSPVFLENPEDYQTNLTGQRRDSDGHWSTWHLPTWDPRSTPVALFHVDRGYMDHRSGVPPGEYYLLGPYANPPPDVIRRSDYGMADLPFPDLEYDVWGIVIADNADLAFLGLENRPTLQNLDLISWSTEAPRILGTTGPEWAFAGSLPPITIRRPELFTSNAVALFIDDGREPRRLRVADAHNPVELVIHPPAKGRIWVEPISRLREFAGLDVVCELPFALLPPCELRWPHGLFCHADSPKIELHSASREPSLELLNATRIDDAARIWQAEPGSTVIEGQLRMPRFAIPVANRLHRAHIRRQNDTVLQFLLSSELDTQALLVACGLPRQAAVIAITDGTRHQSLGTMGQFNDAGECRFPASAIRDAITHFIAPAGLLAIQGPNGYVPTTTHFIRCPELCLWIEQQHHPSAAPWWPLLPASLASALDSLLEIKVAPVTELSVSLISSAVPEPIATFIKSVTVCAVVFDGTVVREQLEDSALTIIEASRAAAPEQTEFLTWFMRARTFAEAKGAAASSSAKTLIDEQRHLNWQPPFQRWRDLVTQVTRYLKDDDEAIPLLEEWKRDVEKGYREPYSSRIAAQNGGRDLTHAWVVYRAGNYPAAVAKAENLRVNGVASPVSDLTVILLRLCWLRMAQFTSQPTIPCLSHNPKLAAAQDDLQAVITFGQQGTTGDAPAVRTLATMTPALPLSDRDRNLFSLFDNSKPTTKSDAETDWLRCYYALRFAEVHGTKEAARALAGRLRVLLNSVPDSADRICLTETMERNT